MFGRNNKTEGGLMYFEASTLDDLLRLVFQQLLRPQSKIKASKDHPFTEMRGWVLQLSEVAPQI